MLRVLANGIFATASSLLTRNQNPPTGQPSTSRWHMFRQFIFSTVSAIAIPFIRSTTAGDTLYECVNTLLASSTTTRNNIDHRQRNQSGINRLSRPSFRRRSNHNGGIVRIIRPTINIHIH
jgi:hypothetical protein